MDDFEALTSLVLGEPLIKHGSMSDMFAQIKAFGHDVDTVWMEPDDWNKLWNDVSTAARYTDSYQGHQVIMLFTTKVLKAS